MNKVKDLKMRYFPKNEYDLLLGYHVLFRKYWYGERNRLQAVFCDFNGTFREFLQITWIFWDHDLVRND